MAILELVKGHLPGTRFELEGDRSVIGRSADCEVPLDVPAVSRRHAEIIRDRGHYFIQDLQSRNGTFLNDNRISSCHQNSVMFGKDVNVFARADTRVVHCQ